MFTATNVRQVRLVITQISGGGAQTVAGIAKVILLDVTRSDTLTTRLPAGTLPHLTVTLSGTCTAG
ncbi:hypothetical protein [Streptomyces sp. NPDC058583]|uniref:hypothetical protein n=1 Tax=unclassified Streptomyces TaxID=2593676 RepID=UPI003666D285